MNYADSPLGVIGNTPLVKLNKIGAGLKANVFAKLEYLNPAGSVKDRMALYIVQRISPHLFLGQKLTTAHHAGARTIAAISCAEIGDQKQNLVGIGMYQARYRCVQTSIILRNDLEVAQAKVVRVKR